MALLSSVESAPRAYWLKASNAAPPISTSVGTIPGSMRILTPRASKILNDSSGSRLNDVNNGTATEVIGRDLIDASFLA